MPIIENTNSRNLQQVFNYIRPIAAIWFIVALLLIAAYYNLFGNYHAKQILEEQLSNLQGTSVQIGSVNLSITEGLIEANNLQVQHPTQPSKNLYEIQSLKGTFELSPLLRKQVVFKRVDLNGVRYLSVRQTPESEMDKTSLESNLPITATFSSNLFSTLNSTRANNPLKHLAQLSTGLHTKELIKERLPHLTSFLTVDQVQRELSKAEHEVERATNPQTTTELNQLIRTRDLINKTQNNLRLQLKALDDTIQKDTLDIRRQLGLPETDSDSFAPVIFGPKTLSFIEQVGQWVEFSRHRMPVRSGPIGKSYVLQERTRGKGVHFPYFAGNPSFVVHELYLSSKEDPATGTGYAQGKITGLTADPYILGVPAEGYLEMSFPEQDLEGIKLNFLIDHVKDQPKENLEIEIRSLKLKNSTLCNITDLTLTISKGEGSLYFKTAFEPHSIKAVGSFKSTGTEFKVNSPYRKIEEYVQSLLVPFYHFELQTEVTGPLDQLTLSLHSTIDSKLTNGLNDEIKRQVSAVDESIKSNLLDQVMPRKHDFLSRLDKMERVDLELVTNQIQREERLMQNRKNTQNPQSGQSSSENVP